VTGASLQGATITMTFSNCAIAAAAGAPSVTYNGSYNYTFDRYVSETDFKFTSTYNNFSVAIAGYPTESFSGTVVCEASGPNVSCSTVVGDSRISGVSLTINGQEIVVNSANIRANFGAANGYVDCVYNGYSFNGTAGLGGTVSITGSNNTSAVITATSTGYTVTITVNGVTTTYTVPRPR
jgi:hypothetical protein